MKFLFRYLGIILLAYNASSSAKSNDTIIAIASGGMYGKYYDVANALCNTINTSKNMYCITRMTEGSVENIKIALEDKTSIGIAQADVLKMYQESNKLRAVIRLYPEVLFMIASNNSNVSNFDDLINQENINIGSEFSGERQTARELLNINDMKRESYGNIPRREILSSLCKNTVDVTFIVNDDPSKFVADIVNKCNSKIISLKEDIINKLIKSEGGYQKFVISKGSYSNQNEDVNTISTEAILFASEDVSEEIIYDLLKIIFSDQKSLHFYLPFLFDFTTYEVLEKTTIPHHKGVDKFLKDMENTQPSKTTF